MPCAARAASRSAKARGKRADQRRGAEEESPDDEQAAAPEMIAERPARRSSADSGSEVGIDHPLNLLLHPRHSCCGSPGRATLRTEPSTNDRLEARMQTNESPARARGAACRTLVGIAWAQSTCCASAASTMLRQVSTSPAAAIASSGSRAVWSTASAWFKCSRHARSTFSPAEGSLPFGIAAQRRAGKEAGYAFDERLSWTRALLFLPFAAQPLRGVSVQSTSNSPAAPIPPPTHIVTMTCFTPRRLPSMRAWPVMRAPLMP